MNWINQIGIWNPQFLRECRGHLKPRTVIATLSISAIFQILLCFLLFQRNTVAPEFHNPWLDIGRFFTWAIPFFLFVIGGYYVVSDLTQEEKEGTLNFIRLSPRPAREILLGKLLGVPIVPYLVVLSVVPLHVYALAQIPLPVSFLLSYYSLLITSTFLCLSLALLAGITGKLQPQKTSIAIAFSGLCLVLFAPFFMFWNANISWYTIAENSRLFDANNPVISTQWLYVNLAYNSFLAYGFTLVNLIIAIGLVWCMLKRLFHQPKTTLISKRLSYLLTAYINVLVWGFFQHQDAASDYDSLLDFLVLYGVNFGLMLMLLLALMPQRQQLFDWLTYPKTNLTTRLWADKSPAFTAIGVNILIAGLLIVPSLLLKYQPLLSPHLLVIPLSIVLSWLIYAALTQIIFTTQVRNPALWSTGTILLLIIVPSRILSIFQKGDSQNPLWLLYRTFFGNPPFYSDPNPVFLWAVGLGIGLQGIVLAALLVLLRHRLQRLRSLIQAVGD
ncbi:hypothetical protein U2F10_08660 [Leptothoe sp. EHU-05/26/07-4]